MLDNQVPSPHPQVAATVVDEQAVIVMADSGQMTVLNEVATRIWQLCDGRHTVAAITEVISAEFDVNAEQARQDVGQFLEQLLALEIILIAESH
jgi:coenzyme PQQ biosynthesis protein PqqD